MKGAGLRQFVMDQVIGYFSGDSLSPDFTEDVATIIETNKKDWDAVDGTYDDPIAADKLDEIIDNTVDDVLSYGKILK